jgi:hypothetical protein
LLCSENSFILRGARFMIKERKRRGNGREESIKRRLLQHDGSTFHFFTLTFCLLPINAASGFNNSPLVITRVLLAISKALARAKLCSILAQYFWNVPAQAMKNDAAIYIVKRKSLYIDSFFDNGATLGMMQN